MMRLHGDLIRHCAHYDVIVMMERRLPPFSFTDFSRCWWFAIVLVSNGGYFDIHFPIQPSPLFLLSKIVVFTAYIPSLPLGNNILESITISLRALLISRMASTLPWIILVFHTIFCEKDRYEIKAPQSAIVLRHSSSCHIASEIIHSTIYMDVLTTILRYSKLDIHSVYLIKMLYTYRGTIKHILRITCRTIP